MPSHDESLAGQSTALVIEDDRDLADYFRRLLCGAGLDVTVVASGHGGMVAVKDRRFWAIVLDMRLPDVDGLTVLAALRSSQPEARIVVVSGHLTVGMAVEAIRLGASHVLEKPVIAGALLAAIESPIFTWKERAGQSEPKSVRPQTHGPSLSDTRSIALRWATHVHRAYTSTDDPRTLELWARSVGVSSTMICESCRMLSIKPHDARDLARALYAMRHGAEWKCSPAVLLDVADSRTLRAFERRAGPWFQSTRHIDTLNRFLDTQSFVSPDNPGIALLRRLLSEVEASL